MHLLGLGQRRKNNPLDLAKQLKDALEASQIAHHHQADQHRQGGVSGTPSAGDKEKTQLQKHQDDAVEKLEACLQLLPCPPDAVDGEGDEKRSCLSASGSPSPLSQQNAERDALLAALLNNDVIPQLALSLRALNFEGRRLTAQLFCNILTVVDAESGSHPVVSYIEEHTEVFSAFLDNYERSKIAARVGSMLRACLLYPPLASLFLEKELIYPVVRLAKQQNFDIASDAFATLSDLLLGPTKRIAAAWLDRNFDRFFEEYWEVLNTDAYVTVRQSLKLLSEMLLDRAYLRPMLKYVRREKFLMLHMEQLRNESKAIAFESFHLFKIFVANPSKPYRVHKILYANREKIMKFLHNFLREREEEQFPADKEALIVKLEELGPPPPPPARSDTFAPQETPLPSGRAAPGEASPDNTGEKEVPAREDISITPSPESSELGQSAAVEPADVRGMSPPR